MPSGKELISTPPAFERLVEQACVGLASLTGLGAVPAAAPPRAPPSSGAGSASTIGSMQTGRNGAATSGARTGITMPSLRGDLSATKLDNLESHWTPLKCRPVDALR